MARGITENDVHQAADALVAGGERPTVERIRAHLGTGSPNTVTRWLETWWQQLGARLQRHALQVALPQAPESVALLAGQLWSHALAEAHQQAGATLEQDHQALEETRTQLQGERDAALAEARDARQTAADARAARDLAVAQARELQQLVEQLKAQTTDLAAQREGAQARADRLEAELLALAIRFEDHKAAAVHERESLEAHRRAFEDRAHREIDLARQATKDTRAEMAATSKAHDVRVAALTGELAQVGQQSIALQAQLGAQLARGQALEEELTILRATLAQATITRTAKSRAAPAAKRRARRPARPEGAG
jgi:hypothetical protein